MRTLGLIDVGSNAIRLKIVRAGGDDLTTVLERREALRLGGDVLSHGRLGRALIDATVAVFESFAADLAAAGCDAVRAVATAAARAAADREELVERIAAATGIALEVISGDEEAALLAAAMAHKLGDVEGQSLWLDLGAGSVEVVAQTKDDVRAASYPLGALRLLRDALGEGPDHGGGVVAALHARIAEFAPAIRAQLRGSVARFGASGGSLERLDQVMRDAGEGSDRDGIRALPLDTLGVWQDRLAARTLAERMAQFDLPADRADTVLPAAAVTLAVGALAGVDAVLIPRVGLKEGMLARMLEADT